MKSRFSTPAILLILILLLGLSMAGTHAGNYALVPAAASVISLVSKSTSGIQGNDHSDFPAISGNGRYVAFASWASNLAPGDTNGFSDIFIHDRWLGQTNRISMAHDGSQANGHSPGIHINNLSLSTDGRYLAFESAATNLVVGDTNNFPDVYVYDQQTEDITLVSVDSNGAQATNDVGHTFDISGDGRFVTFDAKSPMVAGDTNGVSDVFVHDRQTGQTTRVSIATGGIQGNNHSSFPSISADGRYVAFQSKASNLTVNDTDTLGDYFVHDRQTGQTSLVSVATDGTSGNGAFGGEFSPTISVDGRYVAFVSDKHNLVVGDTNNVRDVFVHDRQTGQTSRISVDSNGVEGNQGSSGVPSISADGRFVTFSSSDSNLVMMDTNGVADVFLHDRQTGETTLVSVASNGAQGDMMSLYNQISDDGNLVVFRSLAGNLVADDTNSTLDIFINNLSGISPTPFQIYLPLSIK